MFRKTKIILLSVLAVMAVGAVTSAPAMAAFKLQWHVNGAEAAGQETTSSGGAFILTAAGKIVKCTAVTDTGNVEASGKDLAKTIIFTGCTANEGKCAAESVGETEGTIKVTSIPTKLKELEGKLIDVFESKTVENSKKETEKEFVTIHFTKKGEPTVPCSETYPETKITGKVAAIVTNLASKTEVQLEFPSTALSVDTLNAFGLSATLQGVDNEKLAAGGELEGV